MTDHRLFRAGALALGILISAAARAEGQTEERYRLVEVAGKALPVEVEKEWRCREFVTEAELMLRPDSLWALQYPKREACGQREEVETEHEDGRFTIVADTIRFHDDDRDDDRDWSPSGDVDVDELATATRAEDGTLTARLRDGKTTLVFRR